ncbi:SNF2 family N-terminal domain-containing protein [Fervidobacterium changbaicum]|uniref:Phospholipase D-like domain-containing protein n=2 Tax=Fervidobacterium TaxID=2422 RepID=A0AAI8GCX2_FERIS|nr:MULTISPECIES: phospholipase D-like domain-containing anti-phage protein [Fervidobacterium]AMW32753.1 phospholipase D-like domain-containing protein [Fervidobacterium islandicum]QAV32788.1 helicase SNF2 [Fervidobacterium changbaicum]SDG95504.1 SNF2 family N-terminal domain-containing protein [Fervidobacterium changbaicum]
MIYRYSSRRTRLDSHFLNEKLKNAVSYDRIAGYFSSSIIEVAGEAIENIEGVCRVVCNSELQKDDFVTISAAVNGLRREWCAAKPEEKYNNIPERLKKLYELIRSGKLQIKVVPNDVFGLIHGKAGVITFKDGRKTAFIGSVNETLTGWKLNYEILWEDDSPEAVDWVQEEFDHFWNSPYAVALPEFVVEDIKRISERKVIYSVDEWKQSPEPASTVVESPIYREELGLWEHQKYFISLAFESHKKNGARYVLADTVGLGKTIQLALAAQLMALYGDKPILVIAPKTLIWQWQDELYNLLDMPSAVWDGKGWVDENGIKYPANGYTAIKKCPRRIGIVPQSLITAKSEQVQELLNLDYECVIVDEAHRARRKNLGPGRENEKPIPNNLMKFLLEISKRTKSMLLATATPVQLYPIEAWDLLYILAQGSDAVLGNVYSMWQRYPQRALDLITGKEVIDRADVSEYWEWIRNPFPPASEDETTFGFVRKQLRMADNEFVIKPDALDRLDEQDRLRIEKRIRRIIDNDFLMNHNPFIRHIVRRTRSYLENNVNPETGEPYLKNIEVVLMGERDDEAIILPPYLQEAYNYAEKFCELLKERTKIVGFFKTLLLRRMGSTMIAGKLTAERILSNWHYLLVEEDYEGEENEDELQSPSEELSLTNEERECLENLIETLNLNQERDPKYNLALKLLLEDKWIERGCIIFSQYYDSAYWIAESLSEDIQGMKIGLYAGGEKSGVFVNGVFERKDKEDLKQMVRRHELKILVSTDAASEGLNLQTLGTLINLDLPWNPTRLEQRKGRIQRIGQVYDKVYIYNMRYKGSVEDRVHQLLSQRFENIYNMFGQIPDVLEDVWVHVALNEIEEAKKKIDALPTKHPFELRYHDHIGRISWENCAVVLDNKERKKHLLSGW